MSGAAGRVVVIGGGVIGAACAYYLSRAGRPVTVLEQGTFGGACSHGNCGFVCPSHVLPLAAPGAVRMALRSLFKRDSPFAVRPRFDPGLWSWFFQFARRCNTADMLAAGHAIQALLNSSRSLYDQIFQDEPLECEWETRGLLFVLQTKAAFDHYAGTAQLLEKEFGLANERYEGPALIDLEPALKPGLAGGWLYRTDGHLRPDKLLASWRRVLASRGVEIREHCTVHDLKQDKNTALAAVTNQGEVTGDAFVVATGAWTPKLAAFLGCKIPIQPGKGYSITMPRPAICPKHPLIFEEHRVAATPMQSGYRLGSTMEFAGYDATLNRRRLDYLKEAAHHYLREPVCEPVQEEWYGWRPMTYDGLPIIDRSPAAANLFIAAGHNMLGLSMAPGTGKLIAELVCGQAPHIHAQAYRVR
jgi:D-amino-acid dehydrogenase